MISDKSLMADWNELKIRLERSKFRSRFHLSKNDLLYINERGLETIKEHAERFVRERLAPAEPKNDGKQTPMRGHPVFIAQHATATCCRSCLHKWHGIEEHKKLNESEISYIVYILMSWIKEQYEK